MITGKTSTGFEFSVDPNAVNDMRFLEALTDVDGGNIMATVTLCRLLLDDDQRKRLYSHVEKDGRAPIDDVLKEIKEILSADNDGKNS